MIFTSKTSTLYYKKHSLKNTKSCNIWNVNSLNILNNIELYSIRNETENIRNFFALPIYEKIKKYGKHGDILLSDGYNNANAIRVLYKVDDDIRFILVCNENYHPYYIIPNIISEHISDPYNFYIKALLFIKSPKFSIFSEIILNPEIHYEFIQNITGEIIDLEYEYIIIDNSICKKNNNNKNDINFFSLHL